MLLTVAYLLAKLPFVCVLCFLCVFFNLLRAVISVTWPFCPVEHLFLHVDFICITCNHLCSQINDDDEVLGVAVAQLVYGWYSDNSVLLEDWGVYLRPGVY